MSAAEYEVAITIRQNDLRSYSDEFLATAWHVAQANPADAMDREAGELAETIGTEIIRRWLKGTEPPLWHHQARSYYWNELRQLGCWKDGVFVPGATPGDDGKAGAA
jgi:hypothetical protein